MASLLASQRKTNSASCNEIASTSVDEHRCSSLSNACYCSSPQSHGVSFFSKRFRGAAIWVMSIMYLRKNPSKPRNDLNSVVFWGSGHPRMACTLSADGRMPYRPTQLPRYVISGWQFRFCRNSIRNDVAPRSHTPVLDALHDLLQCERNTKHHLQTDMYTNPAMCDMCAAAMLPLQSCEVKSAFIIARKEIM